MPHMFISNGILRELLSHATNDEKKRLTELLSGDKDVVYSHEKIQEDICLLGGHSVVNFFRGSGTGYIDILDDIAEELDIKDRPSYFSVGEELSLSYIDEISCLAVSRDEAIRRGVEYVKFIEEKIILKILEQAYAGMTQKERHEFDSMVNEVAQKFGNDPSNTLIGSAGLIVLGNLGGFATYTFLTTAMGAISMGGLSFGAYTTATSALSVVLGPVGWIGLGAVALYAYGRPKYDKLMPIVATIGMIRQRLEYENASKC